MKWSNETMEALRAWLAPGTWHTDDDRDNSRFCVFVASVWNDEHRLWNQPDARAIIEKEAVELQSGEDTLAKKVAEERVSEGTIILDFLSLLREKGRFELLTP